MPVRKDMKNILHGFSSAFVSRNNDIGGYWGLGVLYRHACSHKTNTIDIDLLSCGINPHNSRYSKFIKAYTDYIYRQFFARSLPRNWLESARITIKFNQPDIDLVKREVYGHRGEPFTCIVEFIDDLGQRCSMETFGRCRKHCSKRESKSTRVFAGRFPR